MSTAPAQSADAGLRAKVRDAWAAALGHGDFADDDQFFTVGGNSLMAIRVTTRLGSELGIRLPVRLLFEYQTVAELTAAVAQRYPAHEPPVGKR